MRTNRRCTLAALLIVVAILSAATVSGQEAPSPEGKKLKELWADFLHYIKIARPALAESFGKAVLAYPDVKPKDLYLLQRETPGSTAVLGRGSRLPGLKDIVNRLRKAFDEGYHHLRSDPAEIANAIDKLAGTMREYTNAAERLKDSGEYALPQLIQRLSDPEITPVLQERIIVLLSRMGKTAVRPLTVALQTSDPKLQEVIANALGDIQYPHAAARLKELSERKGVLARIRLSARRALATCAGQGALTKSVAELYYDQAIKYYYQRESISPDPRYPTGNVWYWGNGRLGYKVVPREIFCDVYAMRMARMALQHDENFYPAVSLWVAANLKRAADLPPGTVDPTYGENTPSQNYFALSSSAKYLQAVLARGLKDNNSAVASGAIRALAETAGAKNLVTPVAGGSQPLVEALGYPDREVRFLAALSLANALPDAPFTGHELVVSQLVEAMRQTGQKTALLIVADDERNNVLKAALRTAGYQVIDRSDPTQALAAAHRSAGIDVAVLSTKPDPTFVITQFRQDPLFVTLPVVVSGGTEVLRHFAAKDGRTELIRADADDTTIAAALAKASKLSGGEEMTPDAAGRWAILAANAVQRLGETGNEVLRTTRAEKPLIAMLDDERAEVRLAGSEALAVMQSAAAQQAIAALTVNPDASENVRVEAFGDLSASLRRYGNQLTEDLSQAVLDVVSGEGSPELLNAAAQALGAMNLPSEQIKSLILRTSN